MRLKPLKKFRLSIKKTVILNNPRTLKIKIILSFLKELLLTLASFRGPLLRALYMEGRDDPGTRIILNQQAVHPSATCFLLSAYMQRATLEACVRIILARG